MPIRRRHVLAMCLAGRAAQVRSQPVGDPPRRIGVVAPSASSDPLGKPFYEEMGKLGWIEGRNVVYDRVFGNDDMATMPGLARALVQRKPDLIVALGPPSADAVKQATASIPVIFAVVVDPLAAGLVASLGRPGGNMTGVTQSLAESLMPKRLELLREVVPGIRSIGLLGNPGDPGSLADQAALAPLLGPLGVTLTVANATHPAEFDATLSKLLATPVQAILPASSIAVTRRAQMIRMTDAARVPVVGLNRPMADAGALFSLGPSFVEQLRRAAHLADKVLHGANPAEVPVEAASLIELVLNRDSARRLGIRFPDSLLLRANEVIG